MAGEISEGFLLTTAQIAATLIGLLLVGSLFYAETGLRRMGHAAIAAGPYFRVGIVYVMSVYFLVLAMSLGLVVLDPAWATLLFVVLGLLVVGSLLLFTERTRTLSRLRPDLLHPVSVWLPWPPTVLGLALPWLLGGLAPDLGAFVTSLLVLGSLAFVATAGLVLSTFELAALPNAGDS